MIAYPIDPLKDPRWEEFVGAHPHASIFHTRQWLEALRRTYGYEPVAITTAHPGQPLSNGVVFCRIRSWLTGRRLVSLPFADHCEPLVDGGSELECILSSAGGTRESQWKYVELRPLDRRLDVPAWTQASAFHYH